MQLYIIITLLLGITNSALCARILLLYTQMGSLIKNTLGIGGELAKRGHEVHSALSD